MRYYNPKYFSLYELLPKAILEELAPTYGSRLWNLLDPRVLWTVDRLRERFGKTIINTWYWGGGGQYRGWRPWDCPIGAKLSMHKTGKAGDLTFVSYGADEIRADIEQSPGHLAYTHITTVERKVSWLHFDVRRRQGKSIRFINP